MNIEIHHFTNYTNLNKLQAFNITLTKFICIISPQDFYNLIYWPIESLYSNIHVNVYK